MSVAPAAGTSPSAQWILELRPHSTGRPATLLPDVQVKSAAAVLGEAPVDWALEVALVMVDGIANQIPQLDYPEVVEELRRGCDAVVIGVLLELWQSNGTRLSVVPEVLLGPAELVSRGIGIEHMLRGIHVAHEVASREVLAACESLVPAEDRFAEVRRISDLLFTLTGLLADAMTVEFAAVQEAWSAGSAAARLEAVREILDGAEPSEAVHESGVDLHYELAGNHVALVLWIEQATRGGTGRLEEVTRKILRESGCTSSLLLPVGRRRVWAWGSRPHSMPAVLKENAVPLDVRVAVGLPAAGKEGFRRSHQEALEAMRLAQLSVKGRRLLSFGEVELCALLSRDLGAARELVLRELGGLASTAEPAVTLRSTLKCYLDLERSLNQSAEILHVARSTVAHRIQRAQDLRGAEIHVRRTQLQVALALADELGEHVLMS